MTYFRPLYFATTTGFAACLWTAFKHLWRQSILIVNAHDEQTEAERRCLNTYSSIRNRPQSTPIRRVNHQNARLIETPSTTFRFDEITPRQPVISQSLYGTPVSHRRCISHLSTQEIEPSGNRHLTRDIYRPVATPVLPSTSSQIVDADFVTQESTPFYFASPRPSSSFQPAQENINDDQKTPGFLPGRVSVPPRTSSISTSVRYTPKSRSSRRTFGTVLRGLNVDQPVERQQKDKAERIEPAVTDDELRTTIKELKTEIEKLPLPKSKSKQRLGRLIDIESPPKSSKAKGKTPSTSEQKLIPRKLYLESYSSKNKSTSAQDFPTARKLEFKSDDKTPNTKSSDLRISRSVDELSPIYELSPFEFRDDKTLQIVNTEDETLTRLISPDIRSDKKKDDLRFVITPVTSRTKRRFDESDIEHVSATKAKCDFLERLMESEEKKEQLENINDLEDYSAFTFDEDLEDENSFTIRDETNDESGYSTYEDARNRSSYSIYKDAKDQSDFSVSEDSRDQNDFSVSEDSRDQNDFSVFHDAKEQFENSFAIIYGEMNKSDMPSSIYKTDQTQLNIEKEGDEQYFSCLNTSGSPESSKEEINPHFQVQSRIILEENDFLLCYDNQTRTPLWTLEMVTRENAQPTEWCHPPMNYTDCRIAEEFQSTKDDYLDVNSFKETRLAHAELHSNDITGTCLFSNVAPQETGGRPHSVKTVWNELYEYIAYLTNLHAQIWILSGVLYKPGYMNNEWAVRSQLVGINKVVVPSDFFKVILAPNCDCPGFRLECFKIKNEFSDNLDVRDYHVSRYELQKDAGFLIFDEVDDCYVTTCDTDPNFAQKYCQ